MNLTPYLDALRRDLATAAATGSAEIERAGELLAGTLDSSARLCLMEALADAADEVSSKLGTASVEVRLRGREADLVVTEITHPDLEPPPMPPPPAEGSGDVARITLRLPEGLKEAVERAAGNEGISVNAWLVRAISGAVAGRPPGAAGPPPPFPPGRASFGRRVTGYAQA
jgi:hypothetical protein